MPDRASAPNAPRIEMHRKLVLASVMLASFMAAVEATIVATAMPSIVADLGGFSLFSWIFSIYLLAQAVTVPIYGKLADLFGRKTVFTVGASLFLLGSALSGLARSMPLLVAFRGLQGLGAGAVLPIATTIVGDIYTIEERARVQGILSSVWGFAAIIGPLLGGFIVTYLHWSLVFWVNLPVGLLAIYGIRRFLVETVAPRQHALDLGGAALLLVALSTLVVALVRGGVAWPWLSLPSALLGGLCAAAAVGFVVVEQSAAEPIVSRLVVSHPVLLVANGAALLSMAAMIGVTSFLPTYLQGVVGTSATTAGFALSAMSIGWPLASTVVGRTMLRLGFRRAALLGGLLLIAGSGVLVLMPPEHGPLWAAAGAFGVGAGLGFTSTTFIVALQSAVPWQQRGAATAFQMLMRNLGAALGAALFGALLNNHLARHLGRAAGERVNGVALDVVRELIDPVQRAALPASLLGQLRSDVAAALGSVYVGVLVCAVLTTLVVALLPARITPGD